MLENSEPKTRLIKKTESIGKFIEEIGGGKVVL